MSKYKPKTPPSTGLEPDTQAPAVRTRAQVLAEFEEQRQRQDDGTPTTAEPHLQVTDPPTAAAVVPNQQAQTPASTTAWASGQLPDPATDPAEQLVQCERAIHAAKAKYTAVVDKAMVSFIDEAGPFIAWVHEHKLYKLMKNAAGKTYRSFEKYLSEQHGISRASGYRITRTIPLLNILNGVNHEVTDLSVRQCQVLHPVRIQHGWSKVVAVWNTAVETKKGITPTPDELEKAKVLLGLTTSPDEDDERPELEQRPSATEIARAAKILVPDTVRQAVREDPESVRSLVRVLNTALEEAGIPDD